MKKTLAFILSVFCVLTLHSQTQIENGNFESWTDSNTPVNWNNTIDVSGYTIYTASRTSDAAQGNYAADLSTVTYFGYTVPGMIQLGNITVETDSMELSGGDSITVKPKGFSFFYKYTPVNNDTAMIFSYLTRYDSDSNKVDTVALSGFLIWDTVDTYTQAFLPYIYLDTINPPDTINIIFISSMPNNPQTGSELQIDSVELLYSDYAYPTFAMQATNVTVDSFTANWFPGIYSNQYYLDVATDTGFTNFLPGYENLLVQDTNSLTVLIDSNSITKYFYRVRVKYGDTAISANSNIIEVEPPFSTVCLDAQNIDTTSFTAVWQNIPFAKSYLIDVAKDEQFTDFESFYQDYNTGKDTNLTITNLDTNNLYYRVKVVYNSDTSAYSNTINVQLPTTTEIKAIMSKPVLLTNNNRLIISELPNISNIEIYDISGHLINRKKVTSSEFEYYFAQKGLYIISINKKNFKIIIK